MNKYSDLHRYAFSTSHLPIIKAKKISHSKELQIDDFQSGLNYFSSPRISSLTKKENERLSVEISPFLSPLPRENTYFSSTSSNISKDFGGLLQRISVITSGKDLNHTKNLLEGNIYSVRLDQGFCEFFKIHTKDKRTPLKVNLRRNCGRLKMFVSRNNEKPSAEDCEKMGLDDSLEYYDKGSVFVCNQIYLSIEALSDTEFSIGISFGNLHSVYIPPENKPKKKKAIHLEYDEIYKSEEKRIELNKKVDGLLKKRKENWKKNSAKNSLASNPFIPSLAQLKPNPNIQERIALVNKRKNEKYLEKKTHVIESLNKKFSRDQQFFINQEKKHKQEEQVKLQKSWMALIHFFISASSIRHIIMDKKLDAFLNLQQSASARLIQKVFKKKIVQLSLKDTILLHARNNLFLFNSVFTYSITLMRQKIVDCIRLSAECTVVSIRFKQFITKIQIIQKASKHFSLRNKTRIDEIIKMWNSFIESILLRKSSKQNMKYIVIPQHIKIETIKKYYFEKLSLYLQSIKTEQHPTSPLKKTQKSVLEFSYHPTQSELKALIHQAADRAEKLINSTQN